MQYFRASAAILSRGVLLALVFATAGCGGGGDNSGGGAVVTTPTPAPTPTPTPSPTATSFNASIVGPLVGEVAFDLNGNDKYADLADSIVGSNRAGGFGRDMPGIFVYPNHAPPPTSELYRIKGIGIDAFTGYTSSYLSAPAGATVLSPLTTLIHRVGSQAAVRRALGLDSGPSAIRPETNLLTFDAAQQLDNSNKVVAREAGRVARANLDIVNLTMLSHFTVDMFDVLKDVIQGSSTSRLDDQSVLSRIFKQSGNYGGTEMPPELFTTAASMYLDYVRFLPAEITDADSAYRNTILLRYFVLPELERLTRFYDHYPVKKLTSAKLTEMGDYFAQLPRPDTLANFYALPDFSDTQFDSFSLGSCNSGGPWKMPQCNDREVSQYFFATDYARYRVISVSLDAENATHMKVALSGDGGITISRTPGFTGYSHFDYRVETTNGLQSTGRYYIRWSTPGT